MSTILNKNIRVLRRNHQILNRNTMKDSTILKSNRTRLKNINNIRASKRYNTRSSNEDTKIWDLYIQINETKTRNNSQSSYVGPSWFYFA